MRVGDAIGIMGDAVGAFLQWLSQETIHDGLVIILGIANIVLVLFMAMHAYRTRNVIADYDARFEKIIQRILDLKNEMDYFQEKTRRGTDELSKELEEIRPKGL